MKLIADAPERSAWTYSQTYNGPYLHLIFLGKLIADAFRALRARLHSR